MRRSAHAMPAQRLLVCRVPRRGLGRNAAERSSGAKARSTRRQPGRELWALGGWDSCLRGHCLRRQAPTCSSAHGSSCCADVTMRLSGRHARRCGEKSDTFAQLTKLRALEIGPQRAPSSMRHPAFSPQALAPTASAHVAPLLFAPLSRALTTLSQTPTAPMFPLATPSATR